MPKIFLASVGLNDMPQCLASFLHKELLLVELFVFSDGCALWVNKIFATQSIYPADNDVMLKTCLEENSMYICGFLVTKKN